MPRLPMRLAEQESGWSAGPGVPGAASAHLRSMPSTLLGSGMDCVNFDGPIRPALIAFSSVLENISLEPRAISPAIPKREF
jgi:hypothetical protein